MIVSKHILGIFHFGIHLGSGSILHDIFACHLLACLHVSLHIILNGAPKFACQCMSILGLRWSYGVVIVDQFDWLLVEVAICNPHGLINDFISFLSTTPSRHRFLEPICDLMTLFSYFVNIAENSQNMALDFGVVTHDGLW